MNPGSTTTTVSATPNASVYGEDVTIAATVSVVSPASGTPTGTIAFYADGVSLGSEAVDAYGNASIDVTSLAAGSDTITASYSGDANFGAQSCAARRSADGEPPGNTLTQVSSAPNPSSVGQDVTIDAAVTAVSPASGVPTGSVTFYADGIVLGSGTLNGSGNASFDVSTLAVGGHSITADYDGDSNFHPSRRLDGADGGERRYPTTTISASPNPSVYGEDVTIGLPRVGASNSGSAGTLYGHGNLLRGQAATLGSATLDDTGFASIDVSNLPVGTQTIVAVYGGDSSLSRPSVGTT